MVATRNFVGDLDDGFFVETVLKATCETTNGEIKKILNVFHHKRRTNANPFTAASFATEMIAPIATAMLAALNARYALQGYDIRVMDNPDNAVTFIANENAGANDEESLPLLDAVKMGLITSSRGKNFLGSKHFCPASEDDTEGDELSASGVTAWGAVRAAIAANLSGTDSNGNTWDMIVLSRSLSDLEARPSVFTYDEVLTVNLNATVGSMRHRREKYSKVP